MIAFLRTLGEAEINSSYLNLTEDDGTTHGNEFPASLTLLVVVDQVGRQTRAGKHHGNQIWGTLYDWCRANRPKAGDQVVVAYDAGERIDGKPVVHLEMLTSGGLSDPLAVDSDAVDLTPPNQPSEPSADTTGGEEHQPPSVPGVPAPRRDQLLRRIVRDTRLSRSLKLLYDHECQLCGETINLPDGRRYSEAHHLRPLGNPHHGFDVANNVVVVCPNHHAMLDLGAIRLDEKAIVTKPGHALATESIAYHNSVIRAPFGAA